MAKVPQPDYDERFSLYGQDPEDVARALVEQGPMEDVDEAEACEDDGEVTPEL